MASGRRKDATQQIGEGHHASVDEIIEIGEHPNNILADSDSNNDSNQQNVEGHHVSNEFAHNIRELADDIKVKLERVPPSDFVAQHCIYRIHETLRKINEAAYTPVVVSIGPFHHGERSLQAMEEYKLIYMRDFLSRTKRWSAVLEECVESIKRIEEEARRCYSEPIKLSSDEFVEIMVVDGLFIIELFRRRDKEVIYNDDPIFSSVWLIVRLVRDMALLENQLPMLVLDRLFNLPALREELQDSSFTMLALYFFYPLVPRNDEALHQYSNYESKHLLDLLGKTFHPCLPCSANKTRVSWDLIPSATELKNAGVKFKMGSGSFLNIKFSGGVLEIPPIFVQDNTDSLLRNLIAFEQCSDGDVNYFTSYACLMDQLINSGSDVEVLRKRGIITNYLGSDEDVSNLFNKLGYEVNIINSYYAELYDQLNIYYKRRRHAWRASLMRDYFHSPWAVVSIVAAILFLVLTITAALFAVLSFFIHKS